MTGPSVPSGERRKSNRTCLIVGGCLLLICGVAAAVACVLIAAFLFTSNSTSGVQTPVVVETSARIEPTAIATPIPTAVRTAPTVAATAKPVLTPTITSLQIGGETLPVKQLFFKEEFTSTIAGWKEEKADDHVMYLENGVYKMYMAAKTANGKSNSGISSIKFKNPPIVEDFALVMDVRATNGPRYNLYGFLYGDEKAQLYYQVYFTDNGAYSISYYGPDNSGARTWQTLISPWREAISMKPQGNWNKVALVRQKDKVTLYLNDQKLYSFDDTHKVGLDSLGLYAGAPEEGVIIAYDNIYLATLR